jgi:hypothetical protein
MVIVYRAFIFSHKIPIVLPRSFVKKQIQTNAKLKRQSWCRIGGTLLKPGFNLRIYLLIL